MVRGSGNHIPEAAHLRRCRDQKVRPPAEYGPLKEWVLGQGSALSAQIDSRIMCPYRRAAYAPQRPALCSGVERY